MARSKRVPHKQEAGHEAPSSKPRPWTLVLSGLHVFNLMILLLRGKSKEPIIYFPSFLLWLDLKELLKGSQVGVKIFHLSVKRPV